MWISWIIWLITTVLMALYAWAGSLASKSDMVIVKLVPGHSAQLRLYRFDEDRLRMHLLFQGGHQQRRTELGNWSVRSDWRETGVLKFENPGSAIRIVASMPDTRPVIYEAMPKSGYGPSGVSRDLTASLSVSPGVWQWPPASEELGLHSGTNELIIEVIAVDGPLVGESVELWVKPALGFKAAMPNVQWLWWSFLWWPIMFPIQVLWAVGLVYRRVNQLNRHCMLLNTNEDSAG
jgi:hypothetical protein